MKALYLLPLAVVATTRAADPPAAVVVVTTDFRVVEGAVPAAGGGYTAGGRVIPAGDVLLTAESRADAVRRMTAAARRPAPAAETGVPAEARRLFAARVQPVLGNLCAGCHARPGHPGEFRLEPVAEGYADPAGAERNLQVALRFVDRADPAASPLVRMATTPHGGQERAAVAGRGAAAGRVLEEWVRAAGR